MDISVARTFLEVVKTGSFVGAANNLNITQTAVSARIRVLEDQLDRPVFIRNKAGARLTQAGEQFLRFASTLVQVWDRARASVALPPGRETVITIGAELSLWNPLLRHWLLWMRRECPQFAVNSRIGTADQLVEMVQDGALDVAIVYAAPHGAGVIAELLFEEKLVQVRTTGNKRPLTPEDHVRIDWGDDFAASYQAAFPDQPAPVMSISYGPLALEYILETGGSGYFRKGFIRPQLEDGRLELIPGSPEFSYSAYVVHSTKADAGVMERIREGLREAAKLIAQEPS
ncbi:DNA-binding transcriptional regulator, LysR family [Sphingomonas sp. OV641]|uniref:LysR family transcriptional regulator n=1 Tax=unclassified Sphingomonas TaxID=196159 RepID=UPI0008343163|nr:MULTISPECIES: LysR family transcriptional regulator [unclassified Sphingomonas]SEI71737.1 DNA-binding transcriptional regulator, LysR family [Sphingomonas sp. OV641]